MSLLFGLVGAKLGYSFSADYAHDYFMRNNMDAEYRLFEMDDVAKIMDIIHNNCNLCGLNVTIPYKSSVIGFLDEIDDDAAEIGAVNCIFIRREHNRPLLHGFNTDYLAFRQVLQTIIRPEHKSALILGTGGVAKAVAFALKTMSIPYMFVSRTKQNESTVCYDRLKDINMGEYNIIINATPCGTAGFECSDVPEVSYNDHSLLFDLVYNPPSTAFQRRGVEKGCVVENGLRMLHLQADLFYERVLREMK